jgi:hypothetical protein
MCLFWNLSQTVGGFGGYVYSNIKNSFGRFGGFADS